MQVHDYPLVCLGKVTVESIDDKEEMQIMDEAFDILGCPYQEKMDIYRVSSLCMQLGRMEFQGMGEVASPKNIDAAPAINGMCVCFDFYHHYLLTTNMTRVLPTRPMRSMMEKAMGTT